MRKLLQKPPWYVGGLAFECRRCGRCCAGPGEGYVWVKAADIEAIAAHLAMDVERLRRAHVRRVGRRWSLKERKPSNDCIFLDRSPDCEPRCLIYPVRPAQCRSWPFWNSNLRDAQSWALTALRCPGLNRGRRFSYDEIERLRKATTE